MGFLDQFPAWLQVTGGAVILLILSAILYWLFKRGSAADSTDSIVASASESTPGSNAETYAPMFRRVSSPTQPVPVVATPDLPQPGLSATTSTPPRTPTKPVTFSEPPAAEAQPAPVAAPVHASGGAPVVTPVVPIARPAVTPRPPTPPGVSPIPQRAVKIQPRTGAPIGDISAKPVTASIGTRLSVLSLSVVDKPYAKPHLKPSEGNVAVAQTVAGGDPTMVRASAPVRVYKQGDSNPGFGPGLKPDTPRASSFREMPPGATSNADKPPTATSPVPPLTVTTSTPSTSRISPGLRSESDALSRFAAQMKSGSEPAAAAVPPSVSPPVQAPRQMTATVPIVSPRMPNETPAASSVGPNTVQLTIGFEIASLQLTPALKLGAVHIRPTSNIVSVQLDATSQATLQRLLAAAPGGGAPAFEIEKLELTSGGKIALITLAPKK